MIKYNLECECGHTFESWFLNSTKYESLIKKKLINCVKCSSTKVKKTLMTPNLSGKSNKVKKNCKNVGDDFPQEARRIHYDKNSSKGIYGKATSEETEELMEEGIEVTTIPWIKDEN